MKKEALSTGCPPSREKYPKNIAKKALFSAIRSPSATHLCPFVTVKRGLAMCLITSGGPRLRGFAASAAHLSDRQAVACHSHLSPWALSLAIRSPERHQTTGTLRSPYPSPHPLPQWAGGHDKCRLLTCLSPASSPDIFLFILVSTSKSIRQDA